MKTKTAPAKPAAAVELLPVELLAIARCFKEKAIETARGKMKEGTSHAIDLTVRITGTLQIGESSPDTKTTTEEPATVELMTFAACCALLRVLNVRKARIVEALQAVRLDAPEDEELAALFTAAQAERAATLPKKSVTKTTKGKAAAITATLSAVKLVKP